MLESGLAVDAGGAPALRRHRVGDAPFVSKASKRRGRADKMSAVPVEFSRSVRPRRRRAKVSVFFRNEGFTGTADVSSASQRPL
jgi:hypothetical protein